MSACMHWHVTYERTDDEVTRVCDDCGERIPSAYAEEETEEKG